MLFRSHCGGDSRDETHVRRHIVDAHEHRNALRRVEEYIDAHLDSALGIQNRLPAWESRCRTSRSFFRSVGLTPHSYIMPRRLARAQDLLARTDLALAEVALTTGFSDQSHFCRRFREFIGLPPRSFRMQHRYGTLS